MQRCLASRSMARVVLHGTRCLQHHGRATALMVQTGAIQTTTFVSCPSVLVVDSFCQSHVRKVHPLEQGKALVRSVQQVFAIPSQVLDTSILYIEIYQSTSSVNMYQYDICSLSGHVLPQQNVELPQCFPDPNQLSIFASFLDAMLPVALVLCCRQVTLVLRGSRVCF